jgi:hypothetical protein
MTYKARLSCVFVVGVGLFVTGCAGSTTTSDSSSQATTTQAAPSATGPAAPAGAKVSANTASDKEIESALAAAGVSNPGRWAHEVVEYRPHPTDDPNLQKLRENLAKYNPGEETLDKIVSALTP